MTYGGTLEQPRQLTAGQLWMLVLTRLVINSAFRLVYPLLPFLALQLQVSMATVSLLITIQVASGLLSLAGGLIGDRIGQRLTMALALTIFAAGSAICAVASSFWLFALGYAVIGMGTAIYIPTLSSYASSLTPYKRRGRVLGTIEMAWALAGIIGMPLLARLVELRDSWDLAFLVLMLGGVLMLGATLLLLPREARSQSAEVPRLALMQVLRLPSVAAMVAFLWLAVGGLEVLFIVQSAWQERFFGLNVAQRGELFGVIGAAELAASLGVVLLADRLGLRRSVLVAFAASALVYLLLPTTLGSLTLYTLALVGLGLCFEFALVAAFPLLSELAPQARGTTIALGTVGISTGRAVGALLGEPVWSSLGPWANGAIAAGATLLGVLLAARYVREGHQQHP